MLNAGKHHTLGECFSFFLKEMTQYNTVTFLLCVCFEVFFVFVLIY